MASTTDQISGEIHGPSEEAPELSPQNSCFICRSRKVKCDRTYPECTTCRRLGLQCPGYNDSDATSGLSRQDLRPLVDRAYRASGIERRRVGACTNCRNAKIRCSKSLPRCRRCIAHDVACVYDSVSSKQRSRNRQQDVSPSTSAASPGESPTTLSSHSGPASMPVPGHLLPEADSWLYHDDLPQDPAHLHTLFGLYFSRVHPRRCLGFIYRPAWMLSLDQGTLFDDFGEPLVLLVCALGAKCLLQTTNHHLSHPSFRHYAPIPGQKWADKAKSMVLSRLLQSSLRNLMALVLLCEYCLQTGQFADAFQLLGNCHRSIRLLGLDSPRYYESSQMENGDRTDKETRIRIVWACYAMDHVLASGVEQNSSWWQPPRLPLPVPDGDFLSQMPSTTPMPSDLGSFAATSGAGCLSSRAHFVYLVSLRDKVLRMVREVLPVETLTSAESPYLQLINELDAWHNALPEPLQLSSRRIYALQEMKTLSATLYLHLAYHITIVGLTRVSLPGFTFPLASTIRQAPPTFISQCQARCLYHSEQVSSIIEMALPHGIEPFDDPFCSVAAFEASKVQIIHAAVIREGDLDAMRAADRCIRINASLIEMTFTRSNLTPLRMLIALLKQHSFTDLAALLVEKLGSRSPEERSAVELNGSEEDCYLTAVAGFRIARQQLVASDLSSPTSLGSTVDKSPATVPPSILTVPNSTPLADPTTRGTEWVEDQGTLLTENLHPLASDNLGLADLSRMDFTTDELDYLTWDHMALGTWPDLNLDDEGIHQLYSRME